MYFRDVYWSMGGDAIILAALLLTVGQLIAFGFAVYQKRRAWYSALCAAHLALGLATLYFLMGSRSLWEPTPPITRWILDVPWPVLAAILPVSAGGLAWCAVDSVRYSRTQLWADSVKSAIELLPVAMAIGTSRNMALINRRMHGYCSALWDEVPTSTGVIWQNVTAVGQPSGSGNSYIVREGDHILLFARQEVRLDDKAYEQVTAQDITEQYRITAELQAKNAKLREVQLRMREVSYQTEAVAAAKELLDIKVKVHDEIGHILLLGKYYFEHVDQDDAELLTAIRHSLDVLNVEEASALPLKDPCAEAVDWAHAIGIEIQIEGDVPPRFNTNSLIAQAIRESATNAIKHANATRLNVQIRSAATAQTTAVRITNDGAAPTSEIAETGGLLSLRHTVESAGGIMLVRSLPAFELTLVLSAPIDEP